MDNEGEKEEEKELQEINHKRKNIEEQDANHQFVSSTRVSGETSSTTYLDEEEEDMLELRLNSHHRPSRPPPSVFSQPQAQNPLPQEVHQQNLVPISYPINSFNRPNGQSSIVPVQATAPPSQRSQPPMVSQQDVKPRDAQMTQPHAVVHKDVRPGPVHIPRSVPQPEGLSQPLVTRRVRRKSTQAPGEGKSETVSAPFPWATTRRATVYSLKYLIDHNIVTITGTVKCKKCGEYEVEYNVVDKYREVGNYFINNMSMMHDRAPNVWSQPVFPTCKYCKQENSARPVLAEKKREINWLFLFLGQMLGCCTIYQLKYFCKHTENHRTGAKDRLLYLTYLGLCKQLDPTGPFNV